MTIEDLFEVMGQWRVEDQERFDRIETYAKVLENKVDAGFEKVEGQFYQVNSNIKVLEEKVDENTKAIEALKKSTRETEDAFGSDILLLKRKK